MGRHNEYWLDKKIHLGWVYYKSKILVHFYENWQAEFKMYIEM